MTTDTYISTCRQVYATHSNGQRMADALCAVERVRANISVLNLPRLDEQVRAIARHKTVVPYGSWLGAFGKTRTQALCGKLNDRPALACVYAHDPDGYVREAAVKAMAKESLSAPTLALLILRCNDWVAAVRESAMQSLETAGPNLSVACLSGVASLVMDRTEVWQRGGAEAAKYLVALPQWQTAVLQMFQSETQGPLGRLLRQQLKEASFDKLLPEMATCARSAVIRSIATQTLLEGQARWHHGYERVWIDKPMGVSARRAVWQSRDLTVPSETVSSTLRTAYQDKSASVRMHAADHLIAHGPIGPTECVAQLADDTSPSVRGRMAYFEQKWGDASKLQKHET